MVEERNQQIVTAYNQGKSLRKLGLTFGVSHERIRQILMDNNVTLRPTGKVSLKVPSAFGKLTTRERFMSRVRVVKDVVKGDHWVWIGLNGRCQRKYGRFVIRGKAYYTHTAGIFITTGRFPKSNLKKLCRITHCVNPAHWLERSTK